MRYIAYGTHGFVLSVSEADSIDSIKEDGIYALDGYDYPVSVEIVDEEPPEDTESSVQVFYGEDGRRYLLREMNYEYCSRDYHLEKENSNVHDH